MTGREGVRLAGALVLGAALAFPAGIVVGRLGTGGTSTGRPLTKDAPAMRDVFSPSIRSDPWFLDRQREGVEALERHCAGSGEYCPEARAARRRLAEIEATD